MDRKFNKTIISIIMIICLFSGGSIISFIGLSKGLKIASALSRPKGATGWVIPEQMTVACTYTPVIIGVSLIILSLIIFTILFVKWINEHD